MIAVLVIGVIFIIPKKGGGITAVKVIDGDTIQISTGEKVRYIGMDTPEVGQCYYEEAKKRNEKLVLGKKVELEKDVSETDKYGRLLRYVYVDGHSVNAMLIEEGYAKVMMVKPDTSQEWFFDWLEESAKERNAGLWAYCK